ncbi:hypothetical protein [Xanthomonas sp. D-109]|uniref:hypothetical protein n=1 Tax=Xanthomonas sp. D-109 TaxID=2821274 RepID=UPI001AD9F9C4|nr:hypothetical protein [Xanthomonas sp. D-109]MBO9881438.1 hypothetical protein [Xanthomonas sp. D-109]
MSFSAAVYRVLIASPSDVAEDRAAVASTIHDWNSHNSKTRGIVLLPVMWETHAAPSLDARPQAVINEQLVRECDMLAGVFWTRLGSPTGEAESGTIEEINWFVREKKPVMIYFSTRNLPNDFDIDQVKRLREFKKQIQQKGLVFDYNTPSTLENMLFKQLTTIVERMNVAPTVNVAELKRATKSEELSKNTQGEEKNLKQDITETEDEIAIYDYSEKSFVVAGNTLEYKDKLKEWGGRWMKARGGQWVWMFAKKSNLERVSKLLKKNQRTLFHTQ